MRKWRKAAAMCMAAVMMCSMTACGSGNKESADTTAAPAETKAEAVRQQLRAARLEHLPGLRKKM